MKRSHRCFDSSGIFGKYRQWSFLAALTFAALGCGDIPKFDPPTDRTSNAISGAAQQNPVKNLVVTDPLVYLEQQKFWAPDGAQFDNFGNSVAISGDTAIVGPSQHTVGPKLNQGSAYIFVRNAGTWTLQATLNPNDGAANDYFGQSVAIDGDTVIVGAYCDDDTGADSGSAYIFVRNGTTWTQQAKITAGNAGAAYDYFGRAVAISGNTVIVGAHSDDLGGKTNQGSAYVFERNPATMVWTERAKLTASDGSIDDSFGFSVALDGDTVIVGAYQDDVIGVNSNDGSAYVFVKPAGGWAGAMNETAKLVASDATGNEFLGYSVGISGDTVVVGEYVTFPSLSQNAAYIFEKPLSGWSGIKTEYAKLISSDWKGDEWFARSVAISGSLVIVGAHYANIGSNMGQGAAYVYLQPGFGWSDVLTESTKITTSDGGAGDEFGFSVALSGNTAIVGAHYDTIGANMGQGSAYVFRVGRATGEECFLDSDCLSNLCDPIDYVCTCTQDAQCPSGQLCNAGVNPSECTACGNGVVDSGEDCEDGNKINGDNCDNNCTVSACGNGIVTAPEACDDGNADVGDGCSPTCTVESGWACGCSVGYGITTEIGRLGDIAEGSGEFVACDDNEVLVGLSVEWTLNAAGTAVSGSATRLKAICGALGVESAGALTTTLAGGIYVGANGCDGWDPSIWSADVYCPQNQVLVGLRGSPAPMMTTYFTSVSIVCQAIGADLVPFGPTTILPVVNPNGNVADPPVDLFCGPGQIVRAFEVAASCGIEGLAVRCAEPRSDCVYRGSRCNAICGDGIVIDGVESCDEPNPSADDCCSDRCFFEQMNTICRASTQACDAAETCSGLAAECPADAAAADGTSCDDGDACTQADSCQSGACAGADPIVCTVASQCHEVSTCNSADGLCSNVVKADGTSCDDGNACTQADSCTQGVCAGEVAVTCPPANECQEAGTCDAATGQCVQQDKPDGTACLSKGTCQAGECVIGCKTAADCGPNPEAFQCFENRCVNIVGPSDGSCACQMPGTANSRGVFSGLGMIAGLVFVAKRRRSKRSTLLQR